jgi:cytochrome b
VNSTSKNSYIWDLPTRVCHWVLALLFIFSWWSGREGGMFLQYHMLCGYCVLSLILFRFLWGFFGTSSSLFSNFLCGPAEVWRYSKTIFHRKSAPYFTHNPLGGWAVMTMLLALLLQIVTGLFANDDLFNEGPLYPYVSSQLSDFFTGIHEVIAYFLIGLILLHILVIAFYQFWKKQYLVQAMITGYLNQVPQKSLVVSVTLWRALFFLVLSALMVTLIVNL